jgi:hypothetical protein
VDQVLEGDDITKEHLIRSEMFGDTQLLDPMEGSDHDYGKSSYYFIVGEGGAGSRGQKDYKVKRRPKRMVH